MVSVADTGAGMTDEVLRKAFEPFFTTKPVGSGTGLGLSQVYGIAKQTGGTVSITTKLGQGTTVAVYLPRTTALPVTRDAEGPAAAPLQNLMLPFWSSTTIEMSVLLRFLAWKAWDTAFSLSREVKPLSIQ